MEKFGLWLIARLREPSTYAGLATLLLAFGVPNSSSWAKDLTMAGMGVSSVLAMILAEAGVK